MKKQRKRINKDTGIPVRSQLDMMAMYLSLGYTKSQSYTKLKLSNIRSASRLQFAN
tara:strand:+ start:60 stop:227 length:168 start_codon:yes stop_codon:yes gene_type:complete